MGLSCGLKIAKLFLFVFNAVFFIIGAVLLGIGIWVAVDNSYIMTFINNFNTGSINVGGLLTSSAYVLIAFGAFIFVVGFLGCCGALKESRLLLGLYAIIIGIILIVELIAVILAAVYHDQTKKYAVDYLKRTITDHYEGTWKTSSEYSIAWDALMVQAVTTAKTFLLASIVQNYEGTWTTINPISMAFDYTQITFKCCGLDSYTDFYTATNWNRTAMFGGTPVNMTVPPSCCMMDASQFPSGTMTLNDNNCVITPTTANSYYTTSCYSAIMNYFQTYSLVIIGVTSAFVFLQLIVIVTACCLCRAIKEDDIKSAASR